MDVRGTSNKQSSYPIGSSDLQKKPDTMHESKDAQGHVSTPCMNARHRKSRPPANPRGEKNESEAASITLTSTEPRRKATGTSSSDGRESIAPLATGKSLAGSRRIVFNRDENLSKYRTDSVAPMAYETIYQKGKVWARERASQFAKADQIFDQNPSEKIMCTDEHLLRVGKESLEKLEPVKAESSSSRRTFETLRQGWLIEATINADDNMLKAFFELAIEFQDKGIDLPSMIVNHAINEDNLQFLRRLNTVYPDTNLKEFFLNGM